MKNDTPLVMLSLLALVLLSLHLTDDIVRGIDRAGPQSLTVIAILSAWAIGLLRADTMPGIVILLLGAIFAAGMPALHLRGSGIGKIVASPGGFFFLWTLFALGVTGVLSFLLSVRALWRLRRPVPA